MQTTHYTLSQKKAHSEFLQVQIKFNTYPSDDLINLVLLPAWRPGRYQLGNFSQYIRNFKANTLEGATLSHTKIGKEAWEIHTKDQSEYLISYEVYTHKIDGGSTYVDEDLWYINFINCMMYQMDSIENPLEVKLIIPDDWKTATSLETKQNILKANNFYELVDSPLIAAKEIQHLQYSYKNTRFHLWMHGQVTIEKKEKVLEDFSKFTKEQVDTMQHFETKDYHFLFIFLNYQAYHGVEHLSSTCIVLGPAKDFNESLLYDNFLGISSHELFHYWNIIRIRPSEMFPYNFKQENYFPTGFVAEGVTTYYGDLFLIRSGVKDEQWYLNELNKLFKRHFENYGRFTYSLADSSKDLWVDGYELGIPNRKVSIYVKGAIIALILDLKIILASKTDKCLDDQMTALWENYYKKSKGYSQEDYIQTAEEISGLDLKDYQEKFIDGTSLVEDTLKELLPSFGYHLERKENQDLCSQYLGIRGELSDQGMKVLRTAINSPGEDFFRTGDIIAAINNKSIDSLTKSTFEPRHKIKVSYWRKGVLKEIMLSTNTEESYYYTFVISPLETLDAEQKKNRKKWLRSVE